MVQGIDPFGEGARSNLLKIDAGLESLRSAIAAMGQVEESRVRIDVERMRARIQQERIRILIAKGEMREWTDARRIATASQVAEWIARHETGRLQNHAEMAIRNATAAIEVALAAANEAQLAVLEAWLAGREADPGRTSGS